MSSGSCPISCGLLVNIVGAGTEKMHNSYFDYDYTKCILVNIIIYSYNFIRVRYVIFQDIKGAYD